MLYDVLVLNQWGVWNTDLTTGSKYRAQERGKYVTPHVPSVQIIDSRGQRVYLDAH